MLFCTSGCSSYPPGGRVPGEGLGHAAPLRGAPWGTRRGASSPAPSTVDLTDNTSKRVVPRRATGGTDGRRRRVTPPWEEMRGRPLRRRGGTSRKSREAHGRGWTSRDTTHVGRKPESSKCTGQAHRDSRTWTADSWSPEGRRERRGGHKICRVSPEKRTLLCRFRLSQRAPVGGATPGFAIKMSLFGQT